MVYKPQLMRATVVNRTKNCVRLFASYLGAFDRLQVVACRIPAGHSNSPTPTSCWVGGMQHPSHLLHKFFDAFSTMQVS